MSVHVRLLTVATLAAAALVAAPTAASAATPTRPAVTSVATTESTATVTWSSSSQAEYHRVCLRRSKKDARCTVASGKVTGTSTTFEGLTPKGGYDYYVSVTAYNGEGQATSARTTFELQPTQLPAAPTGLKVVITPSTATVTWTAAARADSYDVCLRRSGSEKTCWIVSARTSATSMRLTGLVPTPGADYFATVRSYRGAASATSASSVRIDLPVSSVQGVTSGRSTSSTWPLTWTPSRNAETYRVEVSTSKDMRSGLRTLTTTTPAVTVTGLTPGRRHYVRVQAFNSPLKGRVSTVVTKAQPTDPARIRVATYNLCGQDKCRTSANRATVKPWSQRKALAGKTIRATGSGIISTQESGDKDTNFISQLPGFKRAAYLSAKSLFYRTDRYSLNRAGGLVLDSSRKRYAVWAELTDKATQTPFIVVDPHLEPYKGATNDRIREAQTRTMLRQVDALNPRDLPVVYAGDFNSNKDNAIQSRYKGGYDGVLKAFRSAGIPNAMDLAADAGVARNSRYNTANQGSRSPIKNGDHVDHVYVTRGIQVLDWRVVIDIIDPHTYRTPFPSDHNPLKADLVVPGLQEKP